MQRPTHLNQENADAFLDAEVAREYRHRPSYTDDAIRFLATLAVDEPRRVLDLGCGTGFVARPIAALVEHVDAVDPSAAMIEVGRREPGGDDPRITWIEGSAERVELSGPYALIVTGEALHWMDWPVVLTRCASLLTPSGSLAISGVDTLANPWDEELRSIIARYSVVRDYVPFNLIDALEREGLFRVVGRFESDIENRDQPIEEYTASFHARSSMTRSRMGEEAALAFDREVEELVRRWCDGRVPRRIQATVTFGKPISNRG
jgi:2-polyprenyl-3-methyl-5-hydroxy-6-metoxy-1,4-benzoquinol methylase